MRAPSSAKAMFAGSENDASLSSLLSSALCIRPCVAVCRARTSCPALCMLPDVCLGSRLAFSELIRIREGRPCTGLYPCVPWMRKPEANDAPSWAQKPQGESEREGGKSRGAPAHVAHVPLRNGTQAAAAAMAMCSRLQEISWQVPLNRSWDIREAPRRTCRRRRRRPRCCRRRCRRWQQAGIPGPWSPDAWLANFTPASLAASFAIVSAVV